MFIPNTYEGICIHIYLQAYVDVCVMIRQMNTQGPYEAIRSRMKLNHHGVDACACRMNDFEGMDVMS